MRVIRKLRHKKISKSHCEAEVMLAQQLRYMKLQFKIPRGKMLKKKFLQTLERQIYFFTEKVQEKKVAIDPAILQCHFAVPFCSAILQCHFTVNAIQYLPLQGSTSTAGNLSELVSFELTIQYLYKSVSILFYITLLLIIFSEG